MLDLSLETDNEMQRTLELVLCRKQKCVFVCEWIPICFNVAEAWFDMSTLASVMINHLFGRLSREELQ